MYETKKTIIIYLHTEQFSIGGLNYVNAYEMIFMLFNKFTFQATIITHAVLSTCEQKAVYTQTPTKKKKQQVGSFIFGLLRIVGKSQAI